jgi:hypothetical protein
VLLDVTSIAPASVLVLDSYFYVVVFHGTTVATWRKAEYHLNPEHAAFAQLLEVCSCGAPLCKPVVFPSKANLQQARRGISIHRSCCACKP